MKPCLTEREADRPTDRDQQKQRPRDSEGQRETDKNADRQRHGGADRDRERQLTDRELADVAGVKARGLQSDTVAAIQPYAWHHRISARTSWLDRP